MYCSLSLFGCLRNGGPRGRRARTKNNLRFIEMQRGEPLVILFHQRRRAHPLRLRPFRASLIRPVFFCLAFVRNSTEAWKCGKRITIERQYGDRRRECQEQEKRERVEGKKEQTGMSSRRS